MSFQRDTHSDIHISNKKESNQTSRNNITQNEHKIFSNRKGKNEDSEKCHIHQLSVEIITYIFAKLDPVSLATVAEVCSYWRHIMMDDNCWRDALISYFGCIPFRRISKESWKTEYILRMHLLRKWMKGGAILTFSPDINIIQSMEYDFNGSMIVASAEHGVAAKCNPMTGKRDRHLIYSNMEKVRHRLSLTKTDGERILWGYETGTITLSVKSNAKTKLKIFSGFHNGPITVLSLPVHTKEVVLSGARDRMIKIWDTATANCIVTLSGLHVPTCMDVTPDHYLIVGYDDGSIAVYKDISLEYLLEYHRRHQASDTHSLFQTQLMNEIDAKKCLIQPPTHNISVHSVMYDIHTSTVIVAYSGYTPIKKYDVNTGRCLTTFTHGHDHSQGITCIQWDTSSTEYTYSLQSSLRRNVNSHTRGSRLELSASNKQIPVITSPTHPTQLLVSGDDLGRICVWNGDTIAEEARPIHILDEHISPISALYIDSFKIVSGSDDGYIYVWDPLSGRVIHALRNKLSKNVFPDITLTRITNIRCNEYQGVVTMGNRVKSWDYSPGKLFMNRISKNKGRSYAHTPRERIRYEINKELVDSIQKIKIERQEERQFRDAHQKMTLGGLSDEEMLEYALMLSKDTVDSDDELMQAVVASLEEYTSDYGNDSSSYDNSTYDNSTYENSTYDNYDDGSYDYSHDHHWPTIAEAAVPTNNAEEELDAELQSVIELSKRMK